MSAARVRAAAFSIFVAALAAAAIHAAAQPLGTEFRVNTYTTFREEKPAIAADSSGNFVIVWQGGSTSGDEDIVGRRFSANGQPLTNDFLINTSTTGAQKTPGVASSATGNFVVVWVSVGQGSYQVLGQRFSSGGGPLGGEFRVSAATTAYPSFPSIASDAAGNFVVAWNSNAFFGSAYIAAQRYASSGAPLGGIFQVNTSPFAIQTGPAVASDPNGNLVVAWNGYDDSSYGIVARRYSNTGAPIGGEFRVNTYTPNGQYDPSVASDSSGNYVIVWHGDAQDATGAGIFGQRYASTGARVGTEFRINELTSTEHYDPAVSRGSSGDFVVAWRGTDANVDGIFARRFSAGGAPVGSDFRVNSTTSGDQTEPRVVLMGNGNFVVTWTSLPQDGNFSGVYTQRYACGVAGDVNGNGTVNVGDVFYLINALFAGGPAPVCSGDVDASNAVNVSDVFYLINYLFAQGPPPI